MVNSNKLRLNILCKVQNLMPNFFKIIPKMHKLTTQIDTFRIGARAFSTKKSWPKSAIDSLLSYSFKKSVMSLSLFSKPAIFTDALIQGEIGITSSNVTQFIIGSVRAKKNTVIISVYEPESKVAAVAHVDAYWTPYQALSIIEKEIKKSGSRNLIVDIATKNLKDNELLESTKLELKKRENMSLRSVKQSATLYINSKTGELIKVDDIYCDFYMMARILDRKLDIKRGPGITFPLAIKFDHRDIPNTSNSEDVYYTNFRAMR